MTKNQGQKPQVSARAREDRLKAALKANMSRRKAQIKARTKARANTQNAVPKDKEAEE